MPSNPYNEDHLVEQPALVLLGELGWHTACGLEDTFAPEGGSLGRRDRREVVLLPRLRLALERLNPGQPSQAINAAIEELSRNRSAMGLVAAIREVFRLIKDGVLVSVLDLERGSCSDNALATCSRSGPRAPGTLRSGASFCASIAPAGASCSTPAAASPRRPRPSASRPPGSGAEQSRPLRWPDQRRALPPPNTAADPDAAPANHG